MNERMTMQDAGLSQKIKAAFPLYPLPATVVGDFECRYEPALSETPMEEEEVYRAFKGKTWDQINARAINDVFDLGTSDESFIFLSPEAWAYYLPAWMMMALTGEEAPYYGESLCEALTQQANTGRLAATYDLLNVAQKEVVAEYLRHAMATIPPRLGRDPATPAYWSYWHRFDPDPLPRPVEMPG